MTNFFFYLGLLVSFFGTEAQALVANSSQAVRVPGIKFAWITESGQFDVILDTSSKDSKADQTIQIGDTSGHLIGYHLTSRTSDSVILSPEESVVSYKNYTIRAGATSLYAYYSNAWVEKNAAYEGPLGVKLSRDTKSAEFRLWSPSAEAVTLLLLDPKSEVQIAKVDLKAGTRGVWSVEVTEGKLPAARSLRGLHYRYLVHAFGQSSTVLDPYARSMAAYDPKGPDYLGTAAVVSESKISEYKPLPGTSARTTDFVGMELHLRDAMMDPNSGVPASSRGTYGGLLPLIEYYKSLGVTHLQLMPLQKFASADESDRSYQGNLPQGNHPNYSWGYDPQNFFTPEGWYSSDPTDPELRIQEVKKMVDAIHEAGLGAILDVVYNHVGNGQGFEAAAPGLYLRRNRMGQVSMATGAGASLETRSPMVRRLILDSLKYWQNVFHFDGFRFDWMGFIDHETMRQIRLQLNPETILYGEAWPTTDLPASEASIKTNLPSGLFIGAFNDTPRDSFTGRDSQGNGFIQGLSSNLPVVRSGILGSIKSHPQQKLLINKTNYVDNSNYNAFADSPAQTMNYLAIHDGFTLWDKINLTVDATKAVKQAMVKSALAMLFTSQGRIDLLSGDELSRSKPLADNDPAASSAVTASFVIPGGPDGTTRFFQPNSYTAPDYTNAIRWDQRTVSSDLTAYLKGLIALRHAVPALRFEEAESIRKNIWFLITDPGLAVVAYTIDSSDSTAAALMTDTLVVIHNGERDPHTVSVPAISDIKAWSIYVDCDHAGIVPLHDSSVSIQTGQVTVPGNCSTVIAK